MREGAAEVVYLQKEDAMKAIQKYHNRELDGREKIVVGVSFIMYLVNSLEYCLGQVCSNVM